ncbi:unnamed protein product [Durusdinium trenchii]|uniref:Uncharacterized protein n=1 Tax=Durusdinium trenchii TaxID=1381693 RepID=A0ABP0QX60_9DINO
MKAWFGLNASLRRLVKNWAVFSAAAVAMLEMGGVDELWGQEEVDDPEAHPEEGPAEAPAPPQQPKFTKSQLYKAYAGKGPTKMVAEFLFDLSLRKHAIIIVQCAQPLEDLYDKDLKAQASGLEDMIRWAVARSSGAWYLTAIDMLAKAKEEVELLEIAFRYSACLASNLVWRMMIHRFALPGAAVPLLARDPGKRKEAMQFLKRIIDAEDVPGCEIPGCPADILSQKVRNAGYQANHRSAAALAFILADYENNFSNARQAELGFLFQAGSIFRHRTKQCARLGNRMAVWCLWFAKFRIEEYILGFKLDSFKESEELPAPEFLFNYTLDDQVCNWKAVTTRILPPSCLPQELQSLTSFAHEVTGTMGLIPAAIYAGAFLTVAQCWQIVRICNCKVPAKGAGSGAGGNLVKVDVARSLIEHFWANESAPKKEEMLSGIMGKVRLKDPTILSILKELDPENAQDKDFLKMKKSCS